MKSNPVMVFSCSYCKGKCVKGIGCFSFPRDRKLCDRWLMACGFDLHPKNNTLKLKLCSLHFEEDCFLTRSNGRRFLKRNAVPTRLHDFRRKINDIPAPFTQDVKLEPEDMDSIQVDDIKIKMECVIDEIKVEYADYDYYLDASNRLNIPNDPLMKIKNEPDDYEDDTFTEQDTVASLDFSNILSRNISILDKKGNNRARKRSTNCTVRINKTISYLPKIRLNTFQRNENLENVTN